MWSLDATKHWSTLKEWKAAGFVRHIGMSGVRAERPDTVAALEKVMQDGADRIRRVFAQLIADPTQLPERARQRLARDGAERTICDYIAGMTDRFLMKMSAD